MRLTENYQWNMLHDALNRLHKQGVLDSEKWATKAKNEDFTVDELTWLNTIILERNINPREKKVENKPKSFLEETDVQVFDINKGNIQLSGNFSLSEFKCSDGSNTVKVCPKLVKMLEQIRSHFGKPVHINSAYRTPTYNKKIGGASSSQHLYGKAADIRINGVTPEQIHAYCNKTFKGIGLGLYNTFVHIDSRGHDARWDFRK